MNYINTCELKLEIINAEIDYFKKKGINNPTGEETLKMRRAIVQRKSIKKLMGELDLKHKEIVRSDK